jgi:hypothetical protein
MVRPCSYCPTACLFSARITTHRPVAVLPALHTDYMRVFLATIDAIPDFQWGHACSGDTDRDGYCIVTVQATGHHTGGPLAMAGLPSLPPRYASPVSCAAQNYLWCN